MRVIEYRGGTSGAVGIQMGGTGFAYSSEVDIGSNQQAASGLAREGLSWGTESWVRGF